MYKLFSIKLQPLNSTTGGTLQDMEWQNITSKEILSPNTTSMMGVSYNPNSKESIFKV